MTISKKMSAAPFAWDENAKIGVFPMLSHNLWDNININR